MGSLDYMENYHPLLGDGRNGAMEMPKHGNGSKSDVGPFPSFFKNSRKSLKN